MLFTCLGIFLLVPVRQPDGLDGNGKGRKYTVSKPAQSKNRETDENPDTAASSSNGEYRPEKSQTVTTELEDARRCC